MKSIKPALACLLLVASLLGACQKTDHESASLPAKSMPVVDVSAVMPPGYWKVDALVTMKAYPGGKAVTHTTSHSGHACITTASLKNFLNADNINHSLEKSLTQLDPEVNYFFRGRHLQVDVKFKAEGLKDSNMILDWHFDDSDHARLYAHMRVSTRHHTHAITTRLKYQRVSATCPGNPDAKVTAAVDVSGLMHAGYWKTTSNMHETRDGKPVARPPGHSTRTICITAADLQDILDSGFAGMNLKQWGDPGTRNVTHSLHGTGLHVVVQTPPDPAHQQLGAKTVRDTHFDDPDHSHTTVHLHNSYVDDGKKHTRSLTLEMTSRKVSAACPKKTGGPHPVAVH